MAVQAVKGISLHQIDAKKPTKSIPNHQHFPQANHLEIEPRDLILALFVQYYF